MTITALVPAAVCIAGALLWLLVERSRPLAIWMFGAGLLVWLLAVADKVVRL